VSAVKRWTDMDETDPTQWVELEVDAPRGRRVRIDDADVREIRALYLDPRVICAKRIAAQYRISESYVHNIGRRYRRANVA
jgi:hypothetical protein